MPRKKIERELVVQEAPNKYSSRPYLATTVRKKQFNLYAKAFVRENALLIQVKQKVVPFLEQSRSLVKNLLEDDSNSLKNWYNKSRTWILVPKMS